MPSPLLGANALPTEVNLGGRAYPIAHGFRDGVRFETMMADARIAEGTKVALAIRIFFGEQPEADLGEVIAAMLDFYRCGKPAVDSEDESDEPLYSYSHDYDLIFAAFVNAYDIDLLDEACELHWFKFRAMLSALPEDSQFMRVIGYRGVQITADMPKEERRHFAKMKRLFALPADASMRPVAIRDEESYRDVLDAVIKAKQEGIVDVCD